MGENGPDVLVIMEHIEGVTAGRWLGERPRSWRDFGLARAFEDDRTID